MPFWKAASDNPNRANGAPGEMFTARCRCFVRWGMSRLLACVVLPVVLLASAEGILRAAHCGRSMRPFIEKRCDGQTVLLRNKAFLQQFFTRPITQAEWEKPEFTIVPEKPVNTVRILVFGSSAALGWPGYDFAFSRCWR